MPRPGWAKWLWLDSEPKPKVIKIPVQQRGLATGQIVFVRVVKQKR